MNKSLSPPSRSSQSSIDQMTVTTICCGALMKESRDFVLGKERHLAPDTGTHSLGLSGAFFVSQLRLLCKTTTWLKQQTFYFSHCSGGGGSEIRVPVGLVSGESPLPGSLMATFLLGPQEAGKERESSLVSLKRTLIL